MPVCAVVMFLVCGCESISNRYDIMGSYISKHEESIDDGIECKIRYDFTEQFNLFSDVGKAKLFMTFMFDDQFDFKNLTLEYDVTADGSWDYDGTQLEVEIDTTSLEFEYVKSNATRYTEEAMVRYLRKYVREDFVPQMREKFVLHGDRCVKVQSVSDTAVVAIDPRNGEKVTMVKTAELEY
jgi:hypothetical protein